MYAYGGMRDTHTYTCISDTRYVLDQKSGFTILVLILA